MAVYPSNRLKSLDALRGFDMFWIVSGEGIIHGLAGATGHPAFSWMSSELHHSPWNGFTFYDLIFPLFIFIAGVSMPFSLGKQLEGVPGALRAGKKRKIFRSMLIRCLLLLLLGMVVNGDLAFRGYEQTRFASVLGRIGLSCFFAALICLNTRWEQQIIWCVSLLLSYWAFMIFIPVPGIGAGVLTPAGNLSGYIDRLYLPGKVLRGSYDPEGILSTIPAIATALLGVFAGNFLRYQDRAFPPLKKAVCLLGAGILLLIAGLIWNRWFPINKNIWSSSFVLYCGGWSALLLGIFYAVIDVYHMDKWCAPFVWLGMNSILIYMASHGVVDFKSTAEFLFGGLLQWIPVAWKMTFLWSFIALLQFGGLYFLYKKRIFWKI